MQEQYQSKEGDSRYFSDEHGEIELTSGDRSDQRFNVPFSPQSQIIAVKPPHMKQKVMMMTSESSEEDEGIQ